MCCGSRMCMLCTCVILVVILIGFLFGFGVFKNGFHKLKDTVHLCDPNALRSLCATATRSRSESRRPFLGYAPPPAPF